MDCWESQLLKARDEVIHGSVFLCADPERVRGSEAPGLQNENSCGGLSGAGRPDDPVDLSLQSGGGGIELRVRKWFGIGPGDPVDDHRRGGVVSFDRRRQEGEAC